MTSYTINVLLIVGLLVGGVYDREVFAQTTSLPQRHVVQIESFAFQPPHITVVPGDTVVWVNRDFVPHFISVGEGTWQSNVLEEHQSWELVVNETGSFSYVCVFHPKMMGIVTTQMSRPIK
ncbi:MAG: plastocyanin/azurin family copper-binding protein [Nitrospirales bacterium]